jgi:hypothetical protein
LNQTSLLKIDAFFEPMLIKTQQLRALASIGVKISNFRPLFHFNRMIACHLLAFASISLKIVTAPSLQNLIRPRRRRLFFPMAAPATPVAPAPPDRNRRTRALPRTVRGPVDLRALARRAARVAGVGRRRRQRDMKHLAWFLLNG